MTFKRATIWGVVAGVVFGGLTFLVACTAERESALHLGASALHWPVFTLIGWLGRKLNGSAEAGFLYLPLVPLYWVGAGFAGGCLTWAVARRRDEGNHVS